MSDLMLITVGLCGLAALFVLVLPRVWTRRVEGESVDDWLNVRQAETDDASLLNDAQLRAWDDKDQKGDNLVVRGASQRWGYQVALACLLVAFTVAMYDRLGAYEDVQIARAIASLESATPDEVTTLITRIEARSSQRPQNLDYHSLLGEYYIATGNAVDALQNFEAILAEAPDAPDVLGRAAQAEFVANGQVLTPRAQQRAEQALASDPRQKSALATLAMGSFGAGQYLEAVGYMRVLRDLEVPGSEAFELMRSAIVEAERRLSESVQASGLPQSSESAMSSVKLGVTVELEEGLVPEAYQGLTLFVIARPAGSQVRMPTAVSKQEVVTWPVSLSLSDANSMAGQALSSLERVDLEVQLSKTGQPGLSNALLTGAVRDISLIDSSSVVMTLRDNAQ